MRQKVNIKVLIPLILCKYSLAGIGICLRLMLGKASREKYLQRPTLENKKLVSPCEYELSMLSRSINCLKHFSKHKPFHLMHLQ